MFSSQSCPRIQSALRLHPNTCYKEPVTPQRTYLTLRLAFPSQINYEDIFACRVVIGYYSRGQIRLPKYKSNVAGPLEHLDGVPPWIRTARSARTAVKRPGHLTGPERDTGSPNGTGERHRGQTLPPAFFLSHKHTQADYRPTQRPAASDCCSCTLKPCDGNTSPLQVAAAGIMRRDVLIAFVSSVSGVLADSDTVRPVGPVPFRLLRTIRVRREGVSGLGHVGYLARD